MTVRNTYLHATTKLNCESLGFTITKYTVMTAENMRVSKAFQSKTELRWKDYLKWKVNEFNICHVCLHLNFWWGQRFPVVGFELVEFVKLQANVLDRQLEHVPETCQVLGDGPRVCVWVLIHKNCIHTHMSTWAHTYYTCCLYVCHTFLERCCCWSDDSHLHESKYLEYALYVTSLLPFVLNLTSTVVK